MKPMEEPPAGGLRRVRNRFWEHTGPLTRPFPSRDRQGAVHAPRSTKTNEGASGRCRGIDNLDPAFNRAFSARIPETINHPTDRKAPSVVLEIP